MNSLLLSMPGSPIIYYGDEIGMGDNIYLGDRNGVRTPMQWSPDRNAGFSRADPQRLYLPPIMDPVYGYQAVNVEAQERDPGSLLNWTKRMLAVRKTSHAFGRGTPRVPAARATARCSPTCASTATKRSCASPTSSRAAQPVELDLQRFKGRVPVELLGRTSFPPIGELPYLLTLPAHGFYWFRLAADAEAPDWHKRDARARGGADAGAVRRLDQLLPRPRGAVAHRHGGAAARAQLESEVLPRYIEAQRWYAPKGEPVRRRAASTRPRRSGTSAGRQLAADASSRCGRRAISCRSRSPGKRTRSTCARSRQLDHRARAPAGERRRASATRSPTRRFCRHVVKAIGESTQLPTGQGTLRFTPTARVRASIAGDDVAALHARPRCRRRAPTPRCTLGERLFLKCYRRLRAGRESRARGRPLPHRGGAASSTACRSRARSNTCRRSRRAGRRSRCCRPTCRTRATAGATRSLPRALRSRAQRGRPKRATAPTSRSSRRSPRAPPSCTARFATRYAAIRRSTPEPLTRAGRRGLDSARVRQEAEQTLRAVESSENAELQVAQKREHPRASSTRCAAPQGRRRSRRATTATTTSARCWSPTTTS